MITKYKYQDQWVICILFKFYTSYRFIIPHKLIKFEVLKHAFGKFTPVIDITAPKEEKKKFFGTQDYMSLFGFSNCYILFILVLFYQLFILFYPLILESQFGLLLMSHNT